MRFRFVLGAVAALGFTLGLPMAALAHTELTEASPADGAQLDEPPTEVVLTFEGEISEDSTFTVTAADGTEVGSGELDLDVADRNVLRGDVSVTADGTYTVAYSIVGEDGDPIEGELSFTVGEAAPGTTPPNTAMAPAAGLNPTLLGVGLLSAAAILALRVRRRRT
ncbi:MAG: copper resistance CopC family protein [Candidatus Limnocylindria bacterium]